MKAQVDHFIAQGQKRLKRIRLVRAFVYALLLWGLSAIRACAYYLLRGYPVDIRVSLGYSLLMPLIFLLAFLSFYDKAL